MDIKKNIDYWVKSAEHDLLTAKSMYKTKHYDWCLFLAHLILEKILKSYFVNDNKNFPPKTHDLLLLAKRIQYSFTEEQLIVLENANNFNLEARYPDEKLSFYQTCTKEYTELHFFKILELYKCLKSALIY